MEIVLLFYFCYLVEEFTTSFANIYHFDLTFTHPHLV